MTQPDTIQESDTSGYRDETPGYRGPFRRIMAVVVRVVPILVVIVLAWSLAEPFTLTRTNAVVSDPDVPKQFDGLRIVFVSDIHAGPYYGPRRMERLVREVNATKPDVIVLGGDYVGGYSGGLNIFYSAARKLDPTIGIVAVMGNHDGWEGAIRSRTAVEGIGASVLDNRSIRIMHGGESIVIAGVADPETGDPNVAEAARDIPEDAFAILVSHNPDVFAEQLPAHARAFDIGLAGNNHGGQVTIFGMYAPVMPSAYGNRYREGWMNESGVDLMVSRGVGTVYVPMRFFSLPEIVVLDLKRGPKEVLEGRQYAHQ